MKDFKMRVYSSEDYKVNNWSGGKTTQTAIYPESADYVSRNFIWRLSSASVELEESDFTRLPDYDRILMVLRGEVVLSYESERVARLAELEQDRFDGGVRTKSFGKITDYNLMYKKGTMGYMEVVRPVAEKLIMSPEKPDAEQRYDSLSEGYYCKEGYAVVSCGKESAMIKEGQQLVIDSPLDERRQVSVMGEGVLIRTQVFFKESEFVSEEIPREKATFQDFKEALKIHLTGFRGSKYIFRGLRTVWYDRELQKGIRKIEGFYLPLWVTLLGIIAITFIGAPQINEHQTGILICMLLWVLLNLFIIWPLVYTAVLPKPIAKHIKKIDSLSPYDKKLYEEDMRRNEKLEKLMGKYKSPEEIAREMEERKSK